MTSNPFTIFFVGLAMLTNSIPTDPGIHVLLPSIHSRRNGMQMTRMARMPAMTSSSQIADDTVPDPSGVEDHESLLVVDQGDIVDDSAWRTGDLPALIGGNGGYKFIRLQGERIRFLTDGVNPAATFPSNIPKLCASAPPLVSDYLPPGYPAASAVIDVTAGNLFACTGTRPGRIDSRLDLNANNIAIVTGTNGSTTKTLVLKPTADVYIVNVPVGYVQNPNAQGSGRSHVWAYYAMLGAFTTLPNGCSASPKAKVFAQCNAIPLIPPGDGGSGVKVKDPPAIVMAANSECSNTQWP